MSFVRGPLTGRFLRPSREVFESPLVAPDAPWWGRAQQVLAGGALVGAAPLLGLIYAGVKLTSPGPFLFAQQRRGAGGEVFWVYKVRTMTLGSERATALGVQSTDRRVTSLGRVLRETKLDELPQLYNVLRGEMRIVGPRPIPLALEEELRSKIPGFGARFSVPPGLTNVSQVSVVDNVLGDDLLADWRRRFEGELHYLRHRSVAYDLVMIGMTSAFVLRKGVRALVPERPAVGAGQPGPERASRPTARPGVGSRGRGAPPVATTNVMGVPVANLDYEGVLDQIGGWVERGQREFVGITPAHSIVEAQSNPAHMAALQASALNTADGQPVAWVQRLLGHRQASRVYGPTLMLEALARAERQGWRVALYGGSEDTLAKLEEELLARFPDLQLVLSESPPFRALSEAEEAATKARFELARPDLVFVGLGSPKQEIWMHERAKSYPGVKLGVGAAFNFHAGKVRQAPPALQKIGMEWAFRLACEPRRLARRYAHANPRFAWWVAKELVRRGLERLTPDAEPGVRVLQGGRSPNLRRQA